MRPSAAKKMALLSGAAQVEVAPFGGRHSGGGRKCPDKGGVVIEAAADGQVCHGFPLTDQQLGVGNAAAEHKLMQCDTEGLTESVGEVELVHAKTGSQRLQRTVAGKVLPDMVVHVLHQRISGVGGHRNAVGCDAAAEAAQDNAHVVVGFQLIQVTDIVADGVDGVDDPLHVQIFQRGHVKLPLGVKERLA